MRLYELTKRLEELEGLDPIGDKLADAVSRLIPHGAVKDLLSGTWLGHSLHPVLTDVPIGTWLSASALDVLGGEETEEAAELLIGAGLVAAVPTVTSGLSDWADTIGGERRLGVLHAAGNATVALLYGGSLWARRRGNRGLGVLLGLSGASVAMLSAYLGGHLSLSLGVGVNQTAFEAGSAEWRSTVPADALGADPLLVDVDGTAVVLVRKGEQIHALANRCSHLGGPLNEGEVHDHSITCPWHLSTFDVRDGSVVTGPARAPQPGYDVRIEGGRIELRRRATDH